jgi:hypothetical protein
MRVFSYVVVWDHGFAPNPYHGYLTLACCKPRIRSTAKPGDWIVGTTSHARFPHLGGRLLFAAQVAEVLSFEQYWNDARFAKKKPNPTGTRKQTCGDNIYDFSSPMNPHQLHSRHSHIDGSEDLEAKKHDLGGKNVLVARNFIYFGRDAIELPSSLQPLIKKGPGHKSNFDKNLIGEFLKFINKHHKDQKGEVRGDPLDMDMSASECRKCSVLARHEEGSREDDEG